MEHKCDDDLLADIIEMLLQDDVEDDLRETVVASEQAAILLPE